MNSPAGFIIPLFDYSDPLIRTSIRAMKYRHRKDIAKPFAHELAKKVMTLPEYSSYFLVPIPMPTIRKYIRGYNQSEVLARHLASCCCMTVDTSILRRCRTAEQQVRKKSREKRLKNQKGTFASTDVTGRRFLLVDDVTTTGATLSEARAVLFAHGASDVKAITIAH